MRALGLLYLCLSLPAFAYTKLSTQIHDVDYGQGPGDEILVLLTSGHVAKIRPEKLGLIDAFTPATTLLRQGAEKLEITLDKDRYIVNVVSAGQISPPPAPTLERSADKNERDYTLTTLPSLAVAKKYFREQRLPSKEETQCFNRAMVWTYEWWLKHSLRSGKLLVFFTRNFIRRFNFEWWFHISPYVHVKVDERVLEKVMDKKYSGGPLDFQNWTNIFTRGRKYVCPIITRYSDYADYPYSGECYLYRTKMYTYQPADLQMYEAWGYNKTNFIFEEVKGAYLEAFDEYLN